MCYVCEESYARIHVINTNTNIMCMRYNKEGNRHRFSNQNHMDP